MWADISADRAEWVHGSAALNALQAIDELSLAEWHADQSRSFALQSFGVTGDPTAETVANAEDTVIQGAAAAKKWLGYCAASI